MPAPTRALPARPTRPAGPLVPAIATLAALATLALAGCDDLEEAFDCVDGDRPQFSRTSLPAPVLNEFYREQVSVSIENTSNDDAFGYEFALEGELPPGIEWYQQERRTVVFEGTAIEAGTWMPTLGVLVTEGDSSVFEAGASTDGLCRTRREATYAFTVASP